MAPPRQLLKKTTDTVAHLLKKLTHTKRSKHTNADKPTPLTTLSQQTQTPAPDKRPKSFLDLPPEIRNIIYKYALTTEYDKHRAVDARRQITLQPRISLANHQTQHEALALFFSEFRFMFDLSAGKHFLPMHRGTNSWMTRVGPSIVQFRDVELEFRAYIRGAELYTDTAFFDEIGHAVERFRAHGRLRSLVMAGVGGLYLEHVLGTRNARTTVGKILRGRERIVSEALSEVAVREGRVVLGLEEIGSLWEFCNGELRYGGWRGEGT